MVYINSRGEVIDETGASPGNIFWKFITFIVLFFKTLIGLEDASLKNNADRAKRSASSSSGGGFFGGSGGGGGRPSNNDNKGPRKFGPRGFKSVTDLQPPPSAPTCSGGACG